MRITLVWFYAVESDCQVLGTMADMVELLKDQLDLLSKFSGAGARSKFDGLDERTLKLLVKFVGSLNLKHVVSKSYQVGDSLHFKLFLTFKESSDLPLLIFPGQFYFEFGTCRNNLNIVLDDLRSQGHKSLCTQFDPSGSCVCDDEDLAILL